MSELLFITHEFLMEKHLDDVFKIDKQNHPNDYLTRKEIIDYLEENTVGHVFIKDNVVAGFCLYKREKNIIKCLRVESLQNDLKILTFIIKYIQSKLDKTYNTIQLEVDERLTFLHRFYKQIGFLAVLSGRMIIDNKVIRPGKVNRRKTKDYYDTYTFEYKAKSPSSELKTEEYETNIESENFFDDDPESGTTVTI